MYPTEEEIQKTIRERIPDFSETHNGYTRRDVQDYAVMLRADDPKLFLYDAVTRAYEELWGFVPDLNN